MKTPRRSTLSIAALLLLSACGGQINSPSNETKTTQAPPVFRSAAALADATFLEPRAHYIITQSDTDVTVTLITSKVATVVKNAQRLQFSDMSMNLVVAQNSKTIAEKDLNSLIDLYIAFFNRAPDADGLNYWVNSIKNGASLDQIAASFYQAALIYPAQTGYSANMSDEDFVRIIYKNVLGRTGATAPNDAEVKYWADDIRKGSARSNLINTMLFSARTFAGDKEWGWVTTLLNNKVALGKYFAIEQGLNYNTPEDSISNTMKMVALVTPTDLAAAKKTLALSELTLNLSMSSGSGQGRMLDCFNPDLYAVGTHIQIEEIRTIQGMPDRTVTDDYKVSGQVDFFGSTALELKGSSVDVNSISTSTSPINWYMGVGKDEYLDFGDGSSNYYTALGKPTPSIIYNIPARRIPFNLEINENFTQTLVERSVDATTREFLGEWQKKEIIQFLGIEEVEVPAGKFKACKLKFTLVFEPPYPDSVMYSWFAAEGPYRGMNVRVQSEGDWGNKASKLSINGK